MSNKDIRAVIDVVETWNTLKQTGRDFKGADLRNFVETMNNRSRQLVQIFEKQDPAFWTGLFELAQNATTLTTPGAKIFADGMDRTKL